MDKLRYERELSGQGFKYVCGVDEVGTGGIQQLEPSATNPLLASRYPRLITRLRTFAAREQVYKRAFARIGNSGNHKTETLILSSFKGAPAYPSPPPRPFKR